MGFPTTNAEIINDALFRAGELTDGSSDYEAKALNYLNRVYMAIAAGGVELDESVNEKWWWLRSEMPKAITLQPVLTGSASVVNGSNAITFSVAPNVSVAERFVRTSGTQDVFRIASHTAMQVNATLDSVYTGPTSGAVACEISTLEYELEPGIMEILSPMRVYQDGKREIEGMDLAALERQYPLTQIWHGTPNAFAQIGTHRIRFSHQGGATGTDLIRVDFDYLVQPADLAKDTNTPLIPAEFRRILSDFTCMFLLVDKDDTKAADMGNLAKNGLRGMAREHRNRSVQFSPSYGHIFPRMDNTKSRRFPLRTTGGRIIGW